MKENTQIQNNKYSDLTFEELKTMAEQGCVDAQYNLAKYYKAKNDWAKAAVLFAKAAEQGDKYAQFYLGVCYELGKGVEQNFVKAADWYTKAADKECLKLNSTLQCSIGLETELIKTMQNQRRG